MYLFPRLSDEENRKIGDALERGGTGPLQAQCPDHDFKLGAGRKRSPPPPLRQAGTVLTKSIACLPVEYRTGEGR